MQNDVNVIFRDIYPTIWFQFDNICIMTYRYRLLDAFSRKVKLITFITRVNSARVRTTYKIDELHLPGHLWASKATHKYLKQVAA